MLTGNAGGSQIIHIVLKLLERLKEWVLQCSQRLVLRTSSWTGWKLTGKTWGFRVEVWWVWVCEVLGDACRRI